MSTAQSGSTFDHWHPDIEEFIDAKSGEERKAQALIDAGYDGSFNGDAYGTVAFQNENLGVRASDEFMKKAQHEEADPAGSYNTRAVMTGQPLDAKHALTRLHKIAAGVRFCGDPEILFTGEATASKPPSTKSPSPCLQ